MNDPLSIQQTFSSDPRLYWLLTAFIVMFGACIGSFLNVVIWRLPRNESLVHPPSRCPKCETPIKPYDNIPVFGWIFLAGKCRSCKATISIRYPLVEAFTAMMFFFTWQKIWHGQYSLGLAIGLLYITAAMIATAFTDIETFIIPNEITFTGIALGIFLAFLQPHNLVLPEITASIPDTPHILKDGMRHLTSATWPKIAQSERLFEGCYSIFSLLLAGGSLWIFLEFGKLLWGIRKGTSKDGLAFRLTPTTIQIDTVFEDTTEELFLRESDTMKLKVKELSRINLTTNTPTDSFSNSKEISITEKGVQIGETTLPFNSIKELSGTATEWRIPREALGFGDVKLLGMLAVFLGGDDAFYILLLASLTGALWGIVASFIKKCRNLVIPFGPFISLGTFIWIYFGETIVKCYTNLFISSSATFPY